MTFICNVCCCVGILRNRRRALPGVLRALRVPRPRSARARAPPPPPPPHGAALRSHDFHLQRLLLRRHPALPPLLPLRQKLPPADEPRGHVTDDIRDGLPR